MKKEKFHFMNGGEEGWKKNDKKRRNFLNI